MASPERGGGELRRADAVDPHATLAPAEIHLAMITIERRSRGVTP